MSAAPITLHHRVSHSYLTRQIRLQIWNQSDYPSTPKFTWSYNRAGHVNYIPTYCNFSQEFPEILSQNQIYIYTLSFTECLGNPKYCIVGYSLTCPIVLCHNSIDHCHVLACPQHKARVSGVGSRTSMFPSERVNLPERAEWNYTCSPLSRSDKSTHSVGNILVLGGWVGGENDNEIW